MIRCARALLVVAAAGSSLAFGAEGRVPIGEPMTITEPGHYVVVRDLVLPGEPVIRIEASPVTLDLNSRTLENGSCPGAVITIAPGSEVVIRDGTLKGGGGIETGGVVGRFERLNIDTCKGHGIIAAGTVTVRDCDIHGGDGRGIRIDGGNGVRILNNHVDGDESGITLNNVTGGEIIGNHVSDGDGTLTITGDGGVFKGGGNVIRENRIATTGSDAGIQVNTRNNLVINNVVSGVGRFGMRIVGDANRVVGNVINGDWDGIRVGGAFNVLENNLTEAHPSGNGCGILFLNDNQHVYRNNTINGSDKGDPVCGPENIDAGGNILIE